MSGRAEEEPRGAPFEEVPRDAEAEDSESVADVEGPPADTAGTDGPVDDAAGTDGPVDDAAGTDGPVDDAAGTDGPVEERTPEEAPDPEALKDDPDELVSALQEAQRQSHEYLDLLRRERAEFENFRKRANRERMEALDRGAEALLADLLGVLEDFDRVLEAAEQSEDSQLAKGVEMVHSALRGVLAEAGLEEVPGAGAPFDPNWHEAMMQVESDEPVEQPVVFEVLRRGYRYKGRVLRPASVSVAQ